MSEINEKNFNKVDLELHTRIRKAKGLNKINKIREYVQFLSRFKRYFHAENVLKYEIRSDPEDNRSKKEFAELYFLLGASLMRQDFFYSARDAFQSYVFSLVAHESEFNTIVYNDKIAEGYWYLAVTYQYIETYSMKNAIKYYKLSIQSSPDSIHAAISKNNLAVLFMKQSEIDGDLKKILKAEEQVNEAKKILNKLTKDKKTKDFVLSHCCDTLGMIEMINGHHDVAKKHLEEAKKYRKDTGTESSAAFFHLGMIYEHKKKYKDAKLEYTKSISTQDKEWFSSKYVSKAYYALGILDLKEKKFDSAERNFKNSLRFDSQNRNAQSHLNLAQEKGDSGEDWWDWWTKTPAKKATLYLLTALAIMIVIVPLMIGIPQETVTLELVKDGNGTVIKDSSKTEIKIERKPADYYLVIFGIIVFVILLPNIKKIKAGAIEFETRDVETIPIESTPPSV